MLLFGNIAATAGGAAADLWKLTAPAPADVDLNAANGATGINAAAPSDNKLKFYFLKSGAVTTGALVYDDGVQHFSTGVQFDGANKLAALAALDAGTGEDYSVIASIGATYMEATDGDNIAYVVSSLLTTERAAGNITTGINVRDRLSQTESQLTIEQGATTPMRRIINAAAWVLSSLGVDVFKIDAAGKINTNQTAAPGVHAVLTAELPIYNAAGVLVGYIPIFT